VSSLLAAALERVQGFLLEPVEVRDPRQSGIEAVSRSSADPLPLGPIEVVVLGMVAGCGVSTLARGLALSLAVPGERESHVVELATTSSRPADGPAAIVWDVAWGEVERATEVARAADAVVLVASGSGHPAIAELVASMLGERFGRLVLIANRVSDPARWSGRAAACVPESRLAAALVGRGRRPFGMFGAVLAELAALVERGQVV
jgi:hypothetical protein